MSLLSNIVPLHSTENILPLSFQRWLSFLFDSWLLILFPQLRSELWITDVFPPHRPRIGLRQHFATRAQRRIRLWRQLPKNDMISCVWCAGSCPKSGPTWVFASGLPHHKVPVSWNAAPPCWTLCELVHALPFSPMHQPIDTVLSRDNRRPRLQIELCWPHDQWRSTSWGSTTLALVPQLTNSVESRYRNLPPPWELVSEGRLFSREVAGGNKVRPHFLFPCFFLFSRNSRVRFWGLVLQNSWIGKARNPEPTLPHHVAVEVFSVRGWLTFGDLALEARVDFLAVVEHRLSCWLDLGVKGLCLGTCLSGFLPCWQCWCWGLFAWGVPLLRCQPLQVRSLSVFFRLWSRW